MTLTALFAILPMIVGWSAAGAPGDRVTRLVVQGEQIFRIPVRPSPGQFEWEERGGPKCVVAGAIRGAFSSGIDHVDFVTVRGRRVRARLENDCPALDFYGGFYLNPEDHLICAGRDSIRSRIGGSCRIESFHLLLPKPKG